MTARQLEVLRQMADAEKRDDFYNAEIISEGILCYLGDEKISRKTLNFFIDHTLVSLDSFSKESPQLWTINGSGRLIAEKPELINELFLRLHSGKSFSVEKDRFVDLKNPGE